MTTKKQVRKATRLIRDLLPILQRLTGENIDVQHREELRSLTGEGVMFDLSRRASALSSETAYGSYQKSKDKKGGTK